MSSMPGHTHLAIFLATAVYLATVLLATVPILADHQTHWMKHKCQCNELLYTHVCKLSKYFSTVTVIIRLIIELHVKYSFCESQWFNVLLLLSCK